MGIFTFLKLFKWYQIAQSITFDLFDIQSTDRNFIFFILLRTFTLANE